VGRDTEPGYTSVASGPGVRTDDPSSVGVIVAGGQRLLGDLTRSIYEDQGFRVERVIADSPEMLDTLARMLSATHRVVVLVDTLGDEWVQAAHLLRVDDERRALLAVTSRPGYAAVRRWKQRLPDDRYLANGLLSWDFDVEAFADAALAAAKRPSKATGFWPDGPNHPSAFMRTDEGERARELRAVKDLSETVVLEGIGVSRSDAALRFGVQPETIGERLARARKLLGVRSDVELGRRAAELGLFDDVED